MTEHTEIGAIIFDCDGTLVDSEGPGLDVMHALVRAKGLDFSREFIEKQFRGAPMADCIGWIAEQLGTRSPEAEAALTREVRQLTTERFQQGLSAFPGAFELLRRLHIPFCVATNGPREKVEMTLKLVGLRPLFGERVFSAYEVGSFKPEPGLFLHAAKTLGIAPERCAVVEDSLPGVQAGLAAGMRVFTLHPPAETPTDIAARVRFIDSLEHLDRLLHGERTGE